MRKVQFVYDREGNSLSVWFDDPKKEHVAEETGDEVILIKDKKGHVIGFEKLNYLPKGKTFSGKTLPVEALVS
ncbi:MAG: DUF2283 domain-containing protein [Elusimicrobia bacterium]|nr:DUF2283 domain-containing protein [Elusimicrobiota bacterium]